MSDTIVIELVKIIPSVLWLFLVVTILMLFYRIPPLAFGITNRPDELLHLTLDALERKR
jgi:hypothetical protein